ncbi:MAG: phospholipid carrier-dependent glycosyltransferase [bacterium]|nr:phospholipid carrier-dependent glycosyltransferase [bacterium]
MNTIISKFYNGKLIVFAIILLSLILRFYKLDQIPSGFHSDEAAFGYNAYSLIQTGKDEYGQFLPLILKSFGDYKGAVYAYLTIPPVMLFGLNEFAVRLPTAIFGVFFVTLSYLLTLQLTKNKKIAIITAALCAINPLSIVLSRVQSDPLVSVVLILFGLYLFLLWVEKKNNLFILFTGFFWIVSLFTYASPRVFLPIAIVILLVFYGKKLLRQKEYLFIPVFILVLLVDAFLFFGSLGSRFQQLNVFNTATVRLVLEEKIREDGHSSALVTRIFHNKPIDYSLFFAKNYFDYFSFDFLFLKGGQPDRESIPSNGLFYFIELPFLIFGAYRILKKKEKWGLFSIVSIIFFPLGLALAVDESPNVHRFFLLVFFVELVVAFGITEFLSEIRNRKLHKIIITLVVLVFVYNSFYFLHQLFVHQPIHHAWYRGYAYKPLVAELQKQYPNYKKIVITKAHASPYIYLLFYSKFDPKKYQDSGSPKDIGGFDKFVFTSLDCPLSSLPDSQGRLNGQPDTLYVNRGSCPIPEINSKLITTVKWKDGSSAFNILEYFPPKK